MRFPKFLPFLLIWLIPAAAFSATVVSLPQTIMGPKPANMVVGPIVMTGDTSSITLSLIGDDAAKFVLSSTTFPASLVVGGTDLPAGTYRVTIVVTRP